jgi:hypothetical protein
MTSAAAALAVPAKPRFEFGGGKKGFTSVSGPSTLETATGVKVTCQGDTDKGEIAANKSNKVVKVFFFFTGCESAGAKCNSPGAKVGEVVTKELNGQLGYLEKVLSGKVGLDLIGAKTSVIEEFSCGPNKFVVQGDVIGEITPINVAVKVFKLAYHQAAGMQVWRAIFLESPIETGLYERVESFLQTSINGGALVPTGLETTDELTTEEVVKIDA